MPIAQAALGLDTSGEIFRRAARQLLRLRQERKLHFQQMEITGPAWPLMLALYVFDRPSAERSVGDLAKAADLPRTTALRWLRRLQEHGIVVLSIDPLDRRVVRVRLTSDGRQGMHKAFAAAAAERRQITRQQ